MKGIWEKALKMALNIPDIDYFIIFIFIPSLI
jgi:hypothetical protein